MKTVCITCRQHPHRKTVAAAHFADRGLSVQWWEGVYGPALFGRTKCLAPGYLGNLLSHRMLWQALLLAGGEQSLILEDDAVLCDGFLGYLHRYQNYHFAWLGHTEVRESDVYGMHCYLVRHAVLPILLDATEHATAPVDVLVSRYALPSMKRIVCEPSLARQRDWPSTTKEVEHVAC